MRPWLRGVGMRDEHSRQVTNERGGAQLSFQKLRCVARISSRSHSNTRSKKLPSCTTKTVRSGTAR